MPILQPFQYIWIIQMWDSLSICNRVNNLIFTFLLRRNFAAIQKTFNMIFESSYKYKSSGLLSEKTNTKYIIKKYNQCHLAVLVCIVDGDAPPYQIAVHSLFKENWSTLYGDQMIQLNKINKSCWLKDKPQCHLHQMEPHWCGQIPKRPQAPFMNSFSTSGFE